jgi:protein MpaA
LAVGVIFLAAAAGGCQLPERHLAGFSVEGRSIHCEEFGQGNEVVFIMATIHGDEPAGLPLVKQLSWHLLWHPDLLVGRRIILMELANPDGFEQNTRHNVNGVDLNRNFPADNFIRKDRYGRTPLSQPESRAIRAVLDRFPPDRVVTIHQPLSCVDYDGPAEELAAAMGLWTDLPVKRLGSRPGSLGSYVGETKGVPIVTLELPESASDQNRWELWQRYGDCLLAAICYPDPLE